MLSQYRHFPKPGAGLTKQKHTNLNATIIFQTLFQKQNPEFKTSKSSNSSRHPDGVGAGAGRVLGALDPGFLGSHPKKHISNGEIFQEKALIYKKLAKNILGK